MLRFVALLLALAPHTTLATATPAPPRDQVTILYDAFGKRGGVMRDWGFAALVEYGGRRILFDTGNNAEIFERNVRALRVDLRRLDFVVISHRHGDHTAGLNYLLKVNPRVTIYAPRENFGVFGSALPGTFYRRDTTLAPAMRYFDGEPPGELRFGSAWPQAHIRWIDSTTELAPGITVLHTVSRTPGTLELPELSLAIATPQGLLLLVGCSHPGIETILQASTAVQDHVHEVFGGLHLVTAADSTITRIASALHDQWRIDLMAPGHCTGEPTFAALKDRFGEAYIYAGVGSVIPVP